MHARLIEKRSESADVTTYIFESKDVPNWLAGQFIEYHLPHENADDRGESRYFTISSAPYEKNIQITTRLNHEHSSTFKSNLDMMEPGDKIEISEPMGEFVVNDTKASYIFIAGGIGITPFRSILLDLAHRGEMADITLLYANRSEEVAFKSELDALTADNASLATQYFIGDQMIELPDILEAISQKNSESVQIYISGPKAMVGSFKKQLKESGYNSELIKTDYFPGYSD